MDSDVRRDLDHSGRAFVEIVWPIIRDLRWLGECDFMSLEEAYKSGLAKILDLYAGFDGLLFYPEGVAGIASRIQPRIGIDGKIAKGKFPYDTFTVRNKRDNGAPTELEKRRAAIQSEGKFLYPHLTFQSYLERWEGPLLSLAAIRTKHLVGIIDHPETTQKQCYDQRTSNATFKAVPWDRISTHPLAAESATPIVKIFRNVHEAAESSNVKAKRAQRTTAQELIEKQGRLIA
jgi:hypothetical protein